MGGTCKRDLQPPDLWINHEQLELGKLDKNLQDEFSLHATPVLRRMETFLGRDEI
jgi:hypothetical protein